MQKTINVDHTDLKPLTISTWYMQVAFWVVLTLVTFFSLTLWYGEARLPHIEHTLLQSILGVLITLPMEWVYRKTWNLQPKYLLAVITASVVAFSLLWSVLRLATFIWLTDEGPEVWADFGGWYFSGFFIFLCWTALYYSLRYYRLALEERDRRLKLVERSRAEKLKRLRAEKAAAETTMKMLRYQLNPHFLFNTLNAVNALIKTREPDKARETVENLSSFLRYTLKGDNKGWVSLAEEVDSLDLYLSIEKVRFGDRLQVRYAIDRDTVRHEVPSLLLQPIVENTIKHAIQMKEESCTITVAAQQDGHNLYLSIADNGPGVSTLEDGEHLLKNIDFPGVGLKNIVDRLDSLYDRPTTATLVNTKGKGLKIVLSLPI